MTDRALEVAKQICDLMIEELYSNFQPDIRKLPEVIAAELRKHPEFRRNPFSEHWQDTPVAHV